MMQRADAFILHESDTKLVLGVQESTTVISGFRFVLSIKAQLLFIAGGGGSEDLGKIT